MYDRHADVSDEDLGIRAFHLKQAKAVERAGDIIKMLTLGSQMRRHARPSIEILREIAAMVDDQAAG